MRLEIVTHCWRYWRLLTYQLSSLARYAPKQYPVTCKVYCCKADAKTVRVLDYFAEWVDRENRYCSQPLVIVPVEMPRPMLMRRAIGRNMAARASKADWVWFADCDYLFGPGCLAALPYQLERVKGPLAFPHTVLAHRCRTLGDAAIAKVAAPGVVGIDKSEFQPDAMNRAIGGIQIVRGDVCREKGYLPQHPQFQQPADRWQRTFEDPAFRHSLGVSRGEPIDLPNLYRIRHTQCGRDTEELEL